MVELNNQMEISGTTPLLNAEEPECAYLLQEVSVFNQRVIWHLEQQQKQEVFALGASGALWAYILQSSDTAFTVIVAAIPFLVSFALAIKSTMLTKSMGESMAYLAALENRFKLQEGLGWVHFYRKNTSSFKKRWRKAFWFTLILVNTILFVLFLSANISVRVTDDTQTQITQFGAC